MMTFPSDHHMRHPPQGLDELWKSTFFFPGRNSTQLFGGRNSTNWLFSNLSPRFRSWCHPHPLVIFSIWGFYFDISEWHIRSVSAWTPALMLHLTNPCAKQKVLSLTKPKGKIYKTKPLSHYITVFNNFKRLKNFKIFWSLVNTREPVNLLGSQCIISPLW